MTETQRALRFYRALLAAVNVSTTISEFGSVERIQDGASAIGEADDQFVGAIFAAFPELNEDFSSLPSALRSITDLLERAVVDEKIQFTSDTLIGMTLSCAGVVAMAFGYTVRVTAKDNQPFVTTRDVKLDRVSVRLEGELIKEAAIG